MSRNRRSNMVNPRTALLPADADTKIASSMVVGDERAFPIFMPNGAFLAPGVVDPVEPLDEAPWHPNSHRTRLLVACASAARDIEALAQAIDAEHPWQRPRPIALLATPLINLCDHVKTLCDRLGPETEERKVWPEADRQLLKEAGRRLKAHTSGSLRHFRHQRTAHVDLDVLRLGAARPSTSLPEMILPPLADSLLVLVMCMNYDRVFTWLRRPPGAPPGEVEVMTEYPIATRVKLDADGRISAFSGQSFIARDPRSSLRDTVFGLFDVYNWLASAAVPAHPRIVLRDMHPK